MNRQSNRKRKLSLQKQTLRRLTTLPEDALRRVVGGTAQYDVVGWDGGGDVVVEGDDGWVFLDQAGRSATGSVLCRW